MSLTTLVNLNLSALFGGMIGFERQWNQGMAGLRTNTLVAFGSACFVSVGLHFGDDRVAAQIVSGIGFLGAGVILHEGPSVRGLNTAATLWCAAAVGALAGMGLRIEAFYAASGVVALNIGLQKAQSAINRMMPHPVDVETVYAVEIVCFAAEEDETRRLMTHDGATAGLELRALHCDRIELPDGPPGGAVRIAAEFASHTRVDAAVGALVGTAGQRDGVASARWSIAATGGAGPTHAGAGLLRRNRT